MVASSSTITDTANPNPLRAALPLLATALSGFGFFGRRRKQTQPSPASASHQVPSQRGERERIKVYRHVGGGSLTPRECEVVQLLSHGLSDKEIALELGIRSGTVKVHVHKVLRKMGAKNRHDELIRRSTDCAVAIQNYQAGRELAVGSRSLSPRECEIAQLLSRGLSNNEIALELGITYGTTKLHIHNIFVKLGAKNRHDALIRRSAVRPHITANQARRLRNNAGDDTAAGSRATDGERPDGLEVLQPA